MPRKRKPIRKKQPKRLRKGFRLSLISLLFILVLLVLWVILQRSLWQPGDRFVLVRQNPDNSATFLIYEPQSQSIYQMDIPASTQLTSANKLGVWRLGSLWQLYSDENLSKRLIAESFTLSMGLAADSWVGNCRGRLLFCTNTGLGLKDKLKLTYFEFSVAKAQHIKVDPVEFGLLHEVRLVDGDNGFVATEKVPNSISRLFASENVLGERARITVKNYSQTSGEIENLSRAIEILGTKIVSVESLEPKDFDCQISYIPKAQLTAKRLANIFSCDLHKAGNIGNFDLSMEVGESFWERF
jgi:hypothetical protein